MLPEYYINLPSKGSFDFVIDQERIEFSYWQRRLVEMTKFEVYVPTDQPFVLWCPVPLTCHHRLVIAEDKLVDQHRHKDLPPVLDSSVSKGGRTSQVEMPWVSFICLLFAFVSL